MLHEKQRARAATLSSDQTPKLKQKSELQGRIGGGQRRDTQGATITQEDLLSALDEIKPSVSEKERKKYDQM